MYCICICICTGRIISRRKQQLLVDKERDLLEAMEPAPVSKGTEKIAKNSEIVRSGQRCSTNFPLLAILNSVIANNFSAKFSDRQELLAEKAKFRENQRNQLELDKEESWFKPVWLSYSCELLYYLNWLV